MIIKTYGCPFSHDVSSCVGKVPAHHQWHHTQNLGETHSSKIALYCDFDMLGAQNDVVNDYKFLWLSESKSIAYHQNAEFCKNFEEIYDMYDGIFTHDRKHFSLMSKRDKVRYIPPASNLTWITNPGIRNKSKICSFICSGKDQCPGHAIRNKTAIELENGNYQVDIYGKFVGRPIEAKEHALDDYMFSITFENAKYNDYYTEKLMDCFATGTIPVYYGMEGIGRFFNTDGIVIINHETNLDDLMVSLTPELYESKMDAIKDNFERCMNTKLADDMIYEEIKDIIG